MALSEIKVAEEDGLKNTVEKAMSLASAGDTVLYSPTFASFGKYFKNEYGYDITK